MKNKSLRNIFALALILFSVFGCGRYEEGPCISFRKPETKLCGCEWKVISFTKNDSDLTNQWILNNNWKFTFVGHYDSDLIENSSMYINDSNNSIKSGVWHFDQYDNSPDEANVYKILFCILSPDTLNYGLYPLKTEQWIDYKILRLKSDELWLQHTDSIQNVYVIKFESN